MAQSIILKRTATSGKVPTTSSLSLGELAINTYDGKIFLKKSGSIESIQTIVTTDSITTGSVSLTGDLTVLGSINARQFNIGIISSSILYQSGSSKFGDTTDDTHQFTGSVSISGSFLLNGQEVGGGTTSGSFTGSFTGDGSGLRGVVSDDLPIDGWDYDSNSSASISDFNTTSTKYLIDFEWESQMGTPIGHKTFISNVSGSTQVVPTDSGVKFVVGNNVVATIDSNGIQASAPAGTVSGSSQLTSSYDSRYVLSGSITQTTWDNIASKPGGIVSSSSQVVGILSSLNTYTTSVDSKFTTLETLTASMTSQVLRIQESTASLNSFSSSQESKNSTLATLSGSIETKNLTLGTYTASLDTKNSTLETYTASLETKNLTLATFSSSIETKNLTLATLTGSNLIKLTNLESTTASLETRAISLATITGSLILSASNLTQRVAANEAVSGTFARTNSSNTFNGTQTFSGSVYIANDLVVQGSSSIQYISASSVSIGTNIIQLNTANPSVRFAGLNIIDSGSIGGSGSFLYDSVQDEFIFVHRGNGTNVTSSHFILGPETYDNLGNETYLTNNKLPKGTGKEHLVDSNITDTGTLITLGSDTVVNGTIVASGTTLVSSSAQVVGILSSLNTYTSSQDTKNSTIATYTASLDTKFTTLQSLTASNQSSITQINAVTASLNAATSSYETKGRGIVSGSSQVDVMSTTNIARLATTGSNTFSSANTFSNTVNVQNFLSVSSASTLNAPSSGKSIEMVYRVDGANDYAFIQTYDRTNSVFKPLRISASTLSLNGGGEGNVGFGLTNAQSQVHLNGTITLTESGYDTVRKHTITHGHSDGSSPNNYVAINVSDGSGTTAERIRINGSGQLLPAANGTQDLGSTSLRWGTIYTSDLSLNNGIGDWTIVEGEDDLFLYNNKKGKVYKFALTEVDPNVATPKKS